MPNNSLFAQKLRSWRVENGTHGRLTQEGLAAVLDVSVDAVGKYERSLSYIRGDFEHRLTERLGWSRAEVLACREDWESNRPAPASTKYQLLDSTLVDALFAGSWEAAIRQKMEMAEEEFATLPDAFSADADVFLPIYLTHREQWAAIMHKGEFVGKWVLLLVRAECESSFKRGELVDENLTVDDIRRPILPGSYFAYSPAVIVKTGHEASGVPLLSSFVGFLEQLVDRDIFLHGIGTTSVSTKGAQLCQDLGMQSLGAHKQFAAFENWLMDGRSIGQSIFGRRSAKLRKRYRQFFDDIGS